MPLRALRPVRVAPSTGPVTRRSLGSQAAVLAVGAMLVQAATLVSLIVLTRLVAKPALGGYQQLWLIYGIVSPFLVGGLPTALQYFIPRARTQEEISKWVLDSYLILAGFGVVSSIAIAVFRHPIADVMNDPPLARALLVYAPYPFFALLTVATPSALIACDRAALASVLNAVNGVLTVVFVVGAATISPTIVSMAAGLTLSAAVVALIATSSVVRALRIRRPEGLRSVAWRPLLTYGLPLALTQLAAMIGFQFDRLLVSNRFSTSDYAVYALGAVEVPVAIVVQQAVNAVLLPAFSRLHAEGDLVPVMRQWHAAIRKTSLVILPLFAFLMVTAGDVIGLLYGAKFGGSVRIFRAYLFLMPLRMATYGLITVAIGRTRVNLYASIVMLLSNVVFAIALFGPLGLLGPAIATPLAMLATTVYYVVRLRGMLSLRIDQLVPSRLLLVNAAVSFASVVPLLPLIAVTGGLPTSVRLAAAFAVFLPTYLIGLRLTRRLTPMEWSLLRAKLPTRARRISPA